MKTIALDLDSVLNLLHIPWSKWIQETLDPNFTLQDWTGWNLSELCSAGPAVYDYLDMEGVFRNCPVAPGAQRYVQMLAEEGHELLVVTACSITPGRGHVIEQKIQWLDEHFPMIHPNNIIVTHRKGLIKADVLLDDGLHNFNGFEGQGVVMARPWNEKTTLPRVVGWSGAFDWFRANGYITSSQA